MLALVFLDERSRVAGIAAESISDKYIILEKKITD